MSSKNVVEELELTAAKCRRNCLRMVAAGGHGHIGGAFSGIDIITALYFYKMNVNPAEPKMEGRDRFILSAGHKCMSQYAVLAEKGYFPKEVLDTYGHLKSLIPGHPDMHKLPGIEANTGALGHGLSIALGMALGLPESNIYVLCGDGELAEGSNWEAFAAAGHYKAKNMVVFLDYNGLQISGPVTETMNFMPAGEKFKAFGWDVIELEDGNDMKQIVDVLDQVTADRERPLAVVAHTTKGKGLPFLEGQLSCHFWTPNEEELKKAVDLIEDSIQRMEA